MKTVTGMAVASSPSARIAGQTPRPGRRPASRRMQGGKDQPARRGDGLLPQREALGLVAMDEAGIDVAERVAERDRRPSTGRPAPAIGALEAEGPISTVMPTKPRRTPPPDAA